MVELCIFFFFFFLAAQHYLKGRPGLSMPTKSNGWLAMRLSSRLGVGRDPGTEQVKKIPLGLSLYGF